MIDNAVFLIVMCVVPWLCYKATQRDNEENKDPNSPTNKTRKN